VSISGITPTLTLDEKDNAYATWIQFNANAPVRVGEAPFIARRVSGRWEPASRAACDGPMTGQIQPVVATDARGFVLTLCESSTHVLESYASG
jgi:hypothetical protein